MFLAVVVLAGFGVVWLARLVVWFRRVERTEGRRWLVASTLVIAAFAMVMSDEPLRVRFEFGQDSFDDVVEELSPAGTFADWAPIDVPDRIGTYEITSAYQVGENVILYAAVGNFFNHAGFAYLPDGPDPRLGNGSFESPAFRSLGDGWYAWTASW